jgi:hypothetical protein
VTRCGHSTKVVPEARAPKHFDLGWRVAPASFAS